MEPPRQREVATAEGDESPGWNRDPPGTGEELSAAWNGTCGGRAERNGAREPPVPSPGGPGCSCSCRGVPSPDRRGPEEEEEEEEGAGGTRRARRRLRHRPHPREKEEGGGKRGRGRRGRGDEGPGPRLGPGPGSGPGPGPGGCPRGLLGSCCRRGCGAPGGLRGWVRIGSRGLRFGFGLLVRVLRALGAFLLLLLFLLLRWGRRSGQRLRDWTDWTLRRNRGGGRGLRDPPGLKEEEEEAVGRLSAMAEVPEEQLNPFAVLGVATTAPHTELRRAYRRLAVLVHPDKNPHPRAEAAFKVLRAAWDMVGSPERRREHEMKLLAQGELARSVGEFLRRVQEELREALNTMGCSKCQGKHRRFELDRDPQRARFCAACGGPHPAEEGDLWAESSLLGLRITYLALMDGRVYDITEWAACQRVGISPDTHKVPYHISFGTRGRTRTKGTPPDLQEFFARVFQGSSGGGPFPPPPPPPPPPSEGPNHPQGPPQTPQGPPKPEGAPPRAEGKHRRRKRPRRPLQR